MSGVYIKGMEMPENCALCPVWDAGNCLVATEAIICEYTKHPSDCPLVNVPPHGRLIDADALVDSFDPSDFWNPDAEDNCFAAIHVVNCAPTVLEAEEGDYS